MSSKIARANQAKCRLGRLLLVLAVGPGVSWGQTQTSAVVFASPDTHVVLPQGLLVTLETVQTSRPPESDVATVPPGIFLETTLDHKLGGKTCKIGDPVHLTLVYPIKFDLDGTPLRVPEQAAVTGHVVLLTSRSKKGDKSRLAFVTDSISWEGVKVPLTAVVIAASAPPSQNAQTQDAKDFMRPVQESAGNAREPARSRAHDASGGVPAPSGNKDPAH